MKRYKVTYIDYAYADSADEAKEIVATSIIEEDLIQRYAKVKEAPEERSGGKG